MYYDDEVAVIVPTTKQRKRKEEDPWQEVRLLSRHEDGKLKRKKGVYSARAVDASIVLKPTTDEGKDKTITVAELPELGEARLVVGRHVLDMKSQQDAMDCLAAVSRALKINGKKKRAYLDVTDVSVQAYVTSLLADPDFEAFVQDLGGLYKKIKKAMP